jgi:PilZ domain
MNQRRTPRVTLRCPILIEGDDFFADGRLVDLSSPGCGIETTHPPQPGEYIPLSVMTSVGIPPLTVSLSKVRWVDHGRCRVEFLLIPDDEQARLKAVMHEIEPLGPRLDEFLRRLELIHPCPNGERRAAL